MYGFHGYSHQVEKDAYRAIKENYSMEELSEWLKDRDSFEEHLFDEFWIDDSVTGNASGSYTFSRSDALDNVSSDFDTVVEACKEFCVDASTIAEKFLAEDWEYFDVTARCYVLGNAISEALDDIEKEVEEWEEEQPKERDITEEELTELREEIKLGSLFVDDYRNSLGVDASAACDFFEGYCEYLKELMEADGITDGEFWDRVEEYDNDDNLIAWLYSFDEVPLKIVE